MLSPETAASDVGRFPGDNGTNFGAELGRVGDTLLSLSASNPNENENQTNSASPRSFVFCIGRAAVVNEYNWLRNA
jgi:hypothetical protein